MRKMMTKEITKTTIKVGKMEMKEDGTIEAVTLPDETMLGNVSMTRAQQLMTKKYDHPVTVFQVLPETVVYEMAVEDFIAVASIKETDSEQVAE